MDRSRSHSQKPPGREWMMTRGEWIIQLTKIALGVAIAAYFVWWSLEVLQRLPPQ